MKQLFERGLVYPRDHVGPYVELDGDVVEVGEPMGDSVKITVRAEYGRISGWADGPFLRVADGAKRARVRVYDSGGGFYPDNRVVSLNEGVEDWSRNDGRRP